MSVCFAHLHYLSVFFTFLRKDIVLLNLISRYDFYKQFLKSKDIVDNCEYLYQHLYSNSVIQVATVKYSKMQAPNKKLSPAKFPIPWMGDS